MAFNNTGNKVVLKGYVASDIIGVTDYSIEFELGVPRKSAVGERTMVDYLTIYANRKEVISFCKQHLRLNSNIVVKGEIRKFYNQEIKICSDDITLSSRSKR